MKTWKKIEETKKRTGDITGLKKRNEEKVQKKIFDIRVENEQKRMKEVVVTAWFTPEIPVSTGPSLFGGLPGLILEVNADRLTMLCTKVVLNPKDKIKIKEPNKGKEVTMLEYEKIAADKAEEMRNQWRGGRGRGNARAIRSN